MSAELRKNCLHDTVRIKKISRGLSRVYRLPESPMAGDKRRICSVQPNLYIKVLSSWKAESFHVKDRRLVAKVIQYNSS